VAENHASKPQSPDILVVEDNIASLRRLTETLSQEGYRVRQADRPEVALQAARTHPPSLILLDVGMPGMSGFEVCRRLKQDERTRDVPVIFISPSHDVEDSVQGFAVGAVDLVSTSFHESAVLARVETHLQLRRTQLDLEALVAERTAELKATNEALEAEIQKRARWQQALAESEQKYRTVVEHGAEGILVMQGGRRILQSDLA
jgi:PleD family two-component response regulator